MIQDKELRIGSKIMYYNPILDKDVETEVLGVYFDHVLMEMAVVVDNYPPINIKGIQPIPLSEEWLKRANFTLVESKEEYNTYENQTLKIVFKNGHYFSAWMITCSNAEVYILNKLDFVHKLQNYYFCQYGKELTF